MTLDALQAKRNQLLAGINNIDKELARAEQAVQRLKNDRIATIGGLQALDQLIETEKTATAPEPTPDAVPAHA